MSSSASDARPSAARCFAVVPAAGVGARLGAALPKQYLEIAGRSLLAWSLQPLLAVPWIAQVLVVVAPGDALAPRACAPLVEAAGARLRIAAVGGATRRDSVLAGLRALGERPSGQGSAGQGPAQGGRRDDACDLHDLHDLHGGPRENDWVLVHDAARPGLTVAALQRLHAALAGHPVGGLLALPVADTVKRADAGNRVAATVPREGLWLAQTPQMFRCAVLRAALERHPGVTDEAAAIEAQGLAALLVEGERRNFKVTTADDLALMTLLLQDGAGERRPEEHGVGARDQGAADADPSGIGGAEHEHGIGGPGMSTGAGGRG